MTTPTPWEMAAAGGEEPPNARCRHADTWFDRSVCEADGWMHTVCSNCGRPLDGECATPEHRAALTKAYRWLLARLGLR
jgi:hypothetical protein